MVRENFPTATLMQLLLNVGRVVSLQLAGTDERPPTFSASKVSIADPSLSYLEQRIGDIFHSEKTV